MIKKTAVLNRCFFPVLLAFFIDNFGLYIVYPIFTPLFLKDPTGLLNVTTPFLTRNLLLGILIASFPLAQFFGAPLLGKLSDQIGRKKVFIMTISGGIIGYFLTGIGIHFKELSLLWTGRTLAGFFAGNLTLCLAAIADITKSEKDRTVNFGWIGIMGGLGFVLAIFIGSSLSNPDIVPWFRPGIPFFITSGLSVINLFLMIRYFKESRDVKPHDQAPFKKGLDTIFSSIRNARVGLIYIVYFLFMLGWITSMQFLSAYLIDLFDASQNRITLTFILIGVTWSFANFIINPLLSLLFKPHRIFFFGLTLLAIFMVLTLIHKEPFLLFLTYFVIASLCAALAWTNGLATLSILGAAKSQGAILGVNQSLVAIASIIGPLIGGFLAGVDIHRLYFFTASCALLGALLLFVRSFEKRKE